MRYSHVSNPMQVCDISIILEEIHMYLLTTHQSLAIQFWLPLYVCGYVLQYVYESRFFIYRNVCSVTLQ